MNAVNTLILSAGLVVGLATFTVLLLRGSFLRLLVELCRSENHGRFWLAFTCVSIVLTALFSALLSVPTASLVAWTESGYLEVLVASFRTGLFGLLLALAAVALGLVVSIGLRESGERARPETNA